MIPKTPSMMENVRRQSVTNQKQNRCSALCSACNKNKAEHKSNDKKQKTNETYAFDDDIFDQFNIDKLHDIINQDDETNHRDSDE
jgi:hypothetical protein